MTEDIKQPEANGASEAERKPKEKLHTIMEAASALTSLGDEESEGSRPGTPKATDKESANMGKDGEVEGNLTDEASRRLLTEQKKAGEPSEENVEGLDGETPRRFIPEHKKPDSAITFPEKLMNMMKYTIDKGDDFCITWCEDGKSFIIRAPDEFTRNVVPKFFKATKFASFTRKLYRWGFRQINRGIGPEDPIIFGNEFFQRDDESLIARMRSITAASTRKHEQNRLALMTSGGSHYSEENKRMLLDQFLHQQKHMNMMQGQFYGGMNPNGSIPLTNALRPSLGLGPGQNPAMHPNNPQMMMQGQHMPNGMGQGMNSAGMQGQPQNFQQQPGQGAANQQGYSHGNHQHSNGNAAAPGQPQYPNPQSTAEIVNAAIAALRQAN